PSTGVHPASASQKSSAKEVEKQEPWRAGKRVDRVKIVQTTTKFLLRIWHRSRYVQVSISKPDHVVELPLSSHELTTTTSRRVGRPRPDGTAGGPEGRGAGQRTDPPEKAVHRNSGFDSGDCFEGGFGEGSSPSWGTSSSPPRSSGEWAGWVAAARIRRPSTALWPSLIGSPPGGRTRLTQRPN
ncbi:hypothetical protein THAOC_34529, partial [Thalassiosira oceanica]